MIACPVCKGPTDVRETRGVANYIRRRRFCHDLKCGQRMTTIEVIIEGGRSIAEPAIVPRRDLEEIYRVLGTSLGHISASDVETLDDD